MKKLLPIIAVALFATLFTSCKKDFNCTCTITDPGSDPETITFSIPKTTKSKAETTCKAAQTTYSIGGSSVACKL